MRVLTGPFEVAGVAGAIARGLQRRGHDVELAVMAEPPFGLPYDRLASSLSARAAVGFGSGARADVVHLHFATSWCEYLDVAAWQVAGRPTVLMHYHGDDVRTREIALREHPARGRVFDVTPNRDERVTVRRLRLARRLCHAAIVGDLELASYVTPWFDTVYVVPVALELPTAPRTLPEPPPGAGPVVFHAPSHFGIKGTDVIERVLAGLPVRPWIVSGVPRDAVHAAIAAADVVVDQLNSVTTGVFALEAMALDKPVLCEFDRATLAPVARDTPAVEVTPVTLESVLRELIADPARRGQLGAAGPPFVARVHAADVIARDMEAVYAHAPRREHGLFEAVDGEVRRIRSAP